MRLIFESESKKDKILHNLSELERNLNKDLYVDFDLEIDTAWLDTPNESNKILSKLKDVIDLISEENTDSTWIKYDLDLAKKIYRQILTLHGSSSMVTESMADYSVYALVDDHSDIVKVFYYRDNAEAEKKPHHDIQAIKLPINFIEWLQDKLVLEDA